MGEFIFCSSTIYQLTGTVAGLLKKIRKEGIDIYKLLDKNTLKKITTIFLLGLTFLVCVGQPKKDKDYCDPYYLGRHCDNINPEQIDYSKDFLDLQTKRYSTKTIN